MKLYEIIVRHSFVSIVLDDIRSVPFSEEGYDKLPARALNELAYQGYATINNSRYIIDMSHDNIINPKGAAMRKMVETVKRFKLKAFLDGE